jgi:hypothetical protein
MTKEKKIISLMILMATLFFFRVLWSSPNAPFQSQLIFLDDVINFIQSNYSEIEWFHVGTGHALTGYKYFQMINGSFFSLDSRLEIYLHYFTLFFFALFLFKILYSYNIKKINFYNWFLIFFILFSFSGASPHGMETGTYFGCILIFYILLSSFTQKSSDKYFIYKALLIPFITFFFLSAYLLPFLISLTIVILSGYVVNKKTYINLFSKNKIFIYYILFIFSFLSYWIMLHGLRPVDLASIATQFNSHYENNNFIILKYIFYGLSSPFLTHEHLELLSQEQSIFVSSCVSFVFLIISSFSIFYSFKNLKNNTLFLIPIFLIFYGIFVSFLISITRPLGDLWILSSWYAFHFKFYYIGILISFLLLSQCKFSSIIQEKFISFSLIIILCFLISSTLYKIKRQPYEKLYWQNIIHKTLNPDELICNNLGYTELAIDCDTSYDVINKLQTNNLGVYKK